jgi:hypothetical protein
MHNRRERKQERYCAPLVSVDEKIEENDEVIILASFLPP